MVVVRLVDRLEVARCMEKLLMEGLHHQGRLVDILEEDLHHMEDSLLGDPEGVLQEGHQEGHLGGHLGGSCLGVLHLFGEDRLASGQAEGRRHHPLTFAELLK